MDITPDVQEACEEIRATGSDSSWARFGKDGSKLTTKDIGTSHDDFLAGLPDDDFAIVYYRVEIPADEAKGTRCAVIEWVGQGASPLKNYPQAVGHAAHIVGGEHGLQVGRVGPRPGVGGVLREGGHGAVVVVPLEGCGALGVEPQEGRAGLHRALDPVDLQGGDLGQAGRGQRVRALVHRQGAALPGVVGAAVQRHGRRLGGLGGEQAGQGVGPLFHCT
ncbi:hypothetical protein [Kitasatospora sp. NPDC091207]|uniref:hypothetical protein n=1 Tax=Kitasatospora sp. NPDC091207 TaxID=3364083 RepID=UPI003814B333